MARAQRTLLAWRKRLGYLSRKKANGQTSPEFGFKAKGHAMAKNTICLWYHKDAEDAARFYAKTFPDSAETAGHHAPCDSPPGKKAAILTVEFTVAGGPCLVLHRGPPLQQNETS